MSLPRCDIRNDMARAMTHAARLSSATANGYHLAADFGTDPEALYAKLRECLRIADDAAKAITLAMDKAAELATRASDADMDTLFAELRAIRGPTADILQFPGR